MDSFYTGKRVMVTGSKGFIGGALCRKLEECGASVWGVDKKQGMSVDVRYFNGIQREFKVLKPEIVFHLASETEVMKSYDEPWEFYSTSIQGTLNVLEMSRKSGVQSVVVASSDKAYGVRSDESLPYRETDKDNPSHEPYGNAKRIADELCADYRRIYDVPVKVLRAVNVYGPGQLNQTTLITNTILRVLRGHQPILHSGYTDTVREWLYIDDVVSAYLRLGASKATGTFNVGSGECYRVAVVVDEILSAMGETLVKPLLMSQSQLRVQNQMMCCERFRDEVYPEWCPVSFRYGIRKTVEWYEKEFSERRIT